MNNKYLKLFYLLLFFLFVGGGNANAQLTQDGDGYYQISSASDLAAFRDLVNTAATSGSKAKLTADIDLTSIPNWTPMGTDGSRFWGEFDGQGHRILHMTITGNTKEQGLFGVVSSATIKNLILDSSCTINSGDCTAALIGCCNGSGTLTIENVGIECDVIGTNQNCAAFLGCNYGGSGITILITNCYNTGNVTGGRESAIITGWFGGHGSVEVRGFWNTGSIKWGQDGDNFLWRNGSTDITTDRIFNINTNQDATLITTDDVTSGKLAYLLNGSANGGVSWYQNLDNGQPVDAHPYPFSSHGTVYYGTSQCAQNTNVAHYSNNVIDETATTHSIDSTTGRCANCREYHLTTGVQMKLLADQFNGGLISWQPTIYFEQDIDFDGVTGYEGVGYRNDSGNRKFCGLLDGQGHFVKNMVISTTNGNVGLVGVAGAGAVIRNVTIHNTCSVTAAGYCAGILGSTKDGGIIKIFNCGNEAAITGGKNTAGIFGVNDLSAARVEIAYCYNKGAINGNNESAGISGWMGHNFLLFKCYNAGIVTGVDGDNILARYDSREGEYANFSDCYQLEGSGHTQANVTTFSTVEMNNGTLLSNLMDSNSDVDTWHQGMGSNPHPVLYNGVEFDENYNYTHPLSAQNDATVYFYRGMVANNWNTLCVPFSLTETELKATFGNDVQIATFADGNSDTQILHFTKQTGELSVSAGVPYLIYPTQSITAATDVLSALCFTGKTISTSRSNPSSGGYTFTGIYDKYDPANRSVFVGSGNKLIKQNAHGAANGTMKGFRAYFEVSGNAQENPAKLFTVDDEPTGIMLPEGTVEKIDKVYNLNGQRVNPNSMRRGIYIVNGKKVLVK